MAGAPPPRIGKFAAGVIAPPKKARNTRKARKPAMPKPPPAYRPGLINR